MRFATIDLGSNTVRFLAVEVRPGESWTVIDEDQEVTRLGEGLAARGVLGEVPMARTRAVVARYVERAARAAAGAMRIVATSAVREAPNGAAFAAAIEGATGRPVIIISGDEEARLTLRGIVAGLGPLAGTVVAFDIGGGSTEYILGEDGVLRSAVSLRLGVVPLTERFPFPGPVDLAAFETMREEIRARLEHELPRPMRSGRLERLIGTAGTVTTLAALDLGLARYEAARVHGHVLTRAAVEAQLHALARLTLAERARLPCLEPGRADLIVPGIAIVIATLDCLGVASIAVSDWGIREGIIAEMIEGGR